ncbi:uncharacterized protein LOC127715997 isoform X1 [Mytilus californianus]|uniref:uncharacterized protein LOC127715997 isoform X1 n=1 Tax=Mytilus californianus TaxID=6549 RepID=UPI00224813CE|nr:uncharacterized protein LOC127715997 isoform X1 [Mytilus californianus]
MAEPATQDASIALYQYLCQEIVGSEENVKARRMMNTVRDYLESDDNQSIITSGSFGEGLEMRGSDLDLMFAMKYIEVCEDNNVPLNPDKAYFIIEADEIQPGYTQLHLQNKHCNKKLNILEICEEIGGEYYCSNFRIKQRFINEFAPIIHGPCTSDKKGVFDIAYCLHCKSWIRQAHQWIKRSNNAWPGYDVKQSIITHGVLFVPIGVKGSSKEDLEWRISFSVGERLLIYAFTHTQLLCYALMKILLKDVIENDLESKDMLCTYFMKTILFWISEEVPLTTWHPANLISNFIKCMKRLTYCVENSDCPHYFIPENNLFENKMKGHAQETLLKKLKSLNSYGWKCILFSNQINKLSFQIQSETPTLYYTCYNSLKIVVSPTAFLRDGFIPSTPSSFEKEVHMMQSFKSSNIKYLCSFYMSKMCHNRCQVLPFDVMDNNKSFYKQYKMCISHVLLNTREDAVSGWLMLASFFYKTKQFQIALDILQYSLLKCSPEKIYNDFDVSNIHNEIYRLNLFMQMSIVQLTKLLLVNEVLFIENSLFTPNELLIGKNTTGFQIPPVVYAHSLRFLCHYQLNNICQCQHSLKDLQLTIEEDYFIAEDSEKASSYNILGIIFHLVGDRASARQVLMKSIEIYQDVDCNSAYRMLPLIG